MNALGNKGGKTIGVNEVDATALDQSFEGRNGAATSGAEV